MNLWNLLFGRSEVYPVVTLNAGDKVYFKNDAGSLRITKTLNAHDRREAKRAFVLSHWELMGAAIAEGKTEKFLRMSYPRGSKRKEAVNGLRMVLQYAPSSVDYDIFNSLKNLYKEEGDKATVKTKPGQWRPKHFKPKTDGPL